MKIAFNTNKIASTSIIRKSNYTSFGESDIPNDYRYRKSDNSSHIYRELKREEIKNRYYTKFKNLYDRADNGDIDNTLFWIMKKRLEQQKAAELADLENGLL